MGFCLRRESPTAIDLRRIVVPSSRVRQCTRPIAPRGFLSTRGVSALPWCPLGSFLCDPVNAQADLQDEALLEELAVLQMEEGLIADDSLPEQLDREHTSCGGDGSGLAVPSVTPIAAMAAGESSGDASRGGAPADGDAAGDAPTDGGATAAMPTFEIGTTDEICAMLSLAFDDFCVPPPRARVALCPAGLAMVKVALSFAPDLHALGMDVPVELAMEEEIQAEPQAEPQAEQLHVGVIAAAAACCSSEAMGGGCQDVPMVALHLVPLTALSVDVRLDLVGVVAPPSAAASGVAAAADEDAALRAALVGVVQQLALHDTLEDEPGRQSASVTTASAVVADGESSGLHAMLNTLASQLRTTDYVQSLPGDPSLLPLTESPPTASEELGSTGGCVQSQAAPDSLAGLLSTLRSQLSAEAGTVVTSEAADECPEDWEASALAIGRAKRVYGREQCLRLRTLYTDCPPEIEGRYDGPDQPSSKDSAESTKRLPGTGMCGRASQNTHGSSGSAAAQASSVAACAAAGGGDDMQAAGAGLEALLATLATNMSRQTAAPCDVMPEASTRPLPNSKSVTGAQGSRATAADNWRGTVGKPEAKSAAKPEAKPTARQGSQQTLAKPTAVAPAHVNAFVTPSTPRSSASQRPPSPPIILPQGKRAAAHMPPSHHVPPNHLPTAHPPPSTANALPGGVSASQHLLGMLGVTSATSTTGPSPSMPAGLAPSLPLTTASRPPKPTPPAQQRRPPSPPIVLPQGVRATADAPISPTKQLSSAAASQTVHQPTPQQPTSASQNLMAMLGVQPTLTTSSSSASVAPVMQVPATSRASLALPKRGAAAPAAPPQPQWAAPPPTAPLAPSGRQRAATARGGPPSLPTHTRTPGVNAAASQHLLGMLGVPSPGAGAVLAEPVPQPAVRLQSRPASKTASPRMGVVPGAAPEPGVASGHVPLSTPAVTREAPQSPQCYNVQSCAGSLNSQPPPKPTFAQPPSSSIPQSSPWGAPTTLGLGMPSGADIWGAPGAWPQSAAFANSPKHTGPTPPAVAPVVPGPVAPMAPAANNWAPGNVAAEQEPVWGSAKPLLEDGDFLATLAQQTRSFQKQRQC